MQIRTSQSRGSDLTASHQYTNQFYIPSKSKIEIEHIRSEVYMLQKLNAQKVFAKDMKEKVESVIRKEMLKAQNVVNNNDKERSQKHWSIEVSKKSCMFGAFISAFR